MSLVLGSQIYAQNQNDSIDYDVNKILKENNRIIKTMLDYRYKGGSGAFERDFFFYVDYNQISRQSCTVGTTIMVFDVHCDHIDQTFGNDALQSARK